MIAQSGKSALYRVSKLLCILLLLFAVSAANASPTVALQNVILTASLSSADAPITISYAVNDVVSPVNLELANLGREFLQPPTNSTALSTAANDPVKPLPAVPATMLMVLLGFLCVSLIKDHRVWLAALAGLLWLGQAGIQAIPQLALRLSHVSHSKQQHYPELACLHCPDNSNRLRSDIEGTRYIGLLHHLAGIPDAGTMSFFSCITDKLQQEPTNHALRATNRTPQSAIIRQLSYLFHAINCSAPQVEQFICFSPAFIFSKLPHGPPILV